LLGQVFGVAIQNVPQQQLGSNTYNFRSHGSGGKYSSP
jgi:hypothetical protein